MLIKESIVWQIAQRDYKFGRGKHKSLTAATYDAIGDHFRGLWGKEAGWAHSVLFTADLRTFSEKLNTKVEIKEELAVIKAEDNGSAMIEADRKIEILAEAVKHELDDENKRVSEIAETARTVRAKRRREI